jgi:hypothetical protein
MRDNVTFIGKTRCPARGLGTCSRASRAARQDGGRHGGQLAPIAPILANASLIQINRLLGHAGHAFDDLQSNRNCCNELLTGRGLLAGRQSLST